MAVKWLASGVDNSRVRECGQRGLQAFQWRTVAEVLGDTERWKEEDSSKW